MLIEYYYQNKAIMSLEGIKIWCRESDNSIAKNKKKWKWNEDTLEEGQT